MCEPVTLTALAVGATAAAVGSQVVAHEQQVGAAEDQAKYQNQVLSRTSKSAYSNYVNQNQAEITKVDQNRSAAFDTADQVQQDANAAKSEAVVSAASRGVSGQSVDLLQRDFERLASENNVNIVTNQDWMTDQVKSELQGFKSDAINRINAARGGPVAKPSLLATGLGIASSVASGATQVGQINRPKNDDSDYTNI